MGGDNWIMCYPQVYEIPELLEIIFQHLEPTTLLALRLVNKTWNGEICRYYQKRCHIRADSVAELQALTTLLKSNLRLELPLPYHAATISIDATKNWDLYLYQFLTLPTVSRLQLHLKLYDLPKTKQSHDQKKVIELLSLPVTTEVLVSFELSCYKLPSLNLGLSQFQDGGEGDCPLLSDLNLVKLKRFYCSGTPCSSDTVHVILQIINSSPNLTLLSLGCDIQGEHLAEIFTGARLNNVETLEFDISQSVLPSMEKLPRLTSVILRFQGFNAETEGIERFNSQREFLHSFSQVIEELKVSWNPKERNLSLKGFPACPRLEKLIIHDWGSNIGAFDHSRLPSLKEISFSQDILLTDNFSAGRTNNCGVKAVSFNRNGGVENDSVPAGFFSRFLRHVSLQFPNVTTLHLTWDIRPDIAGLLVSYFRNLVHLELVSRLGFEEVIFTGHGRSHFHGIVLGNQTNVSRKPCLIDLRRLRTLRLETAGSKKNVPDFSEITNNSLKYGIARMPNLERLKMNWNKDLNVDNVINSLSHLDSIELIVNKNQVSNQTYKRLLLHWPRIKMQQIKYSERQPSWMSWFVTRVWSFISWA